MIKELFEECEKQGTNPIPFIIDFIEKLEPLCPEAYDLFIVEFSPVAYGMHFSEASLMIAYEYMDNADGTQGAHWTLAQTNTLATQLAIDFTIAKFNEYDFNYTVNMMYSDYYAAIGTNDLMYANLALLFLNDIDAKEGKAYMYFTKMIQGA